MKIIRLSARFFLGIPVRVKNTLKLIMDKSLYSGESYYPEYSERIKKTLGVFKDQFIWVWKYGNINEFYYLYGFDIKDCNPEDYVDYRTVFRSTRERLNKKAGSSYMILKNKLFFGLVAEGIGIIAPPHLAFIEDEQYWTLHGTKCIMLRDIASEYPLLDVFVKLTDGECANGVFHLLVKDGKIFIDNQESSIDNLMKLTHERSYIVQKRIEQHNAIKAIFPLSINTIRLVTVYDKKHDDIAVFSAVMRIGTGENHVDNWAKGGLSIGIDIENGTLRKWGFYKPGFGTKTDFHPDTKAKFEGFKIPYFKESIEMAKRFHRQLKGVHSIGWDVAITPNGPCFIEGNDNWEISLMQVCNHGLRKEFEEYFV